MPVGDALGFHIELEFKAVFTVVLSLAACVAAWRYIRAVRKSARPDSTHDKNATS